jgi:hypothetical protein
MLLKKRKSKYAIDQSKWWGYLHVNGTLQVKAYYSVSQIEDAEESPFVKTIILPFKADTREEASMIINKKIRNEELKGKRSGA